MNKESVLFLTKDALCKDYLPVYGNKYWKGKTPNLDELAAKGTVYNNFFTAAPSSSMSYLSMFTRMNPYQQDIQSYIPLTKPFKGKTLFDEAFEMGFKCHVFWDATWKQMAMPYTQCYGSNTQIHYLAEIKQPVGSHYLHKGRLERNIDKEIMAFNKVEDELKEITQSNDKIFLWCHLPHVLNGRVSYCDDIDLYDRYIGMFRKYFDDANIFISADHGNMNGLKGKIGYGFDVYDKSIQIPFISPRINGLPYCDKQISNVNVYELIFQREIVSKEIIYSDSAYYAQPNRKLAIIAGKFRYIFNRKTGKEELYDVEWDPHEDFNLMDDNIYDIDRHVSTPSCEYYFYPYWHILPEIRKRLRDEKDKIWRTETFSQHVVVATLDFLRTSFITKSIYPSLNRLAHRLVGNIN